MTVTGECKFVSATTGLKKDGVTPWRRTKFYDSTADEIVVAYVDEHIFDAVMGLEKMTPVMLTMELVPGSGSRFFEVLNVEVIVET